MRASQVYQATSSQSHCRFIPPPLHYALSTLRLLPVRLVPSDSLTQTLFPEEKPGQWQVRSAVFLVLAPLQSAMIVVICYQTITLFPPTSAAFTHTSTMLLEKDQGDTKAQQAQKDSYPNLLHHYLRHADLSENYFSLTSVTCLFSGHSISSF